MLHQQCRHKLGRRIAPRGLNSASPKLTVLSLSQTWADWPVLARPCLLTTSVAHPLCIRQMHRFKDSTPTWNGHRSYWPKPFAHSVCALRGAFKDLSATVFLLGAKLMSKQCAALFARQIAEFGAIMRLRMGESTDRCGSFHSRLRESSQPPQLLFGFKHCVGEQGLDS